jgi:hypothetical protein
VERGEHMPHEAGGRSASGVDLDVGITYGGLGFLLGGLGGCLVLLSRDLGVPRGELSWLSAGFGVALLLAGLVGPGALRLGAGWVLRTGCAALATGSVLLALSSSVGLAQLGALLVGVGGASAVLAAPALLTGAGAAARLTRVNAASSLAGVTAPVLLGAVDFATRHGRLALLLPAPALFALIVRRRRGALTPTERRRNGEADGTPAPWQVAIRWAAVVAAVCPEFAFVVWGAARMQDSGLGAAGAAAAATAFPVGMGIGRLLGPRYVPDARGIGAGVALGILGTLLVAAPVGPVPVALGIALAGLGIAVLYPLTLSRLVHTPGLGLQRGSALAAVASGVAVLGAPVALDRLASSFGLRTAFLAAVPPLLVIVAAQRVSARRPG